MISFKRFILESAYIPKEISAKTFIEWCEENASQYLQRIATAPIYRGFTAPSIGLINTNGMNRTSANTINYYTLWIDNHRDWEEYPKRSKSLICSTDFDTSDSFGEVQLIIPADNNRIGICSQGDLWISFPFLFNIVDVAGDMAEFMSVLHETLIEAGKYSQNTLREAQHSYEILIKCLKNTTLVDLIEWESNSKNNTAERLISILKRRKLNNMYELMEDSMQPEENDFKVTTAARFKQTGDHEVWVQGECATIDFEYMRLIINEKNSNSPIYKFAEKYNMLGIFR